MSRLQVEEITNVAKDAAYVSVGLGVIAFQRLQVRRNELNKAIAEQTEGARGALELVGSLVNDRVKLVEERLGSVLERGIR